MVLDWERGELAGIPAWDWFHFVLQPAILVAREDTAALVRRLEGLLASADFQIIRINRDLGRDQLFALLQCGLAVAETVLKLGLEMARETIS